MAVIRLKGRDNARWPMMWDNSRNAGFTLPETKTWIRMNDEYADLNVQAQERDPDSVLNYFKQLTHIRRQHPMLVRPTAILDNALMKILTTLSSSTAPMFPSTPDMMRSSASFVHKAHGVR